MKPPMDRVRPTQRGWVFSVHSFIEQPPKNKNRCPVSAVIRTTCLYKSVLHSEQGKRTEHGKKGKQSDSRLIEEAEKLKVF